MTWRTSRCSHGSGSRSRSEEHTSELQSRLHLVCRLLLEKKKKAIVTNTIGSTDHSTMSIFATHNSRMIDLPRVPFITTKTHTEYTSSSRSSTATTERSPT